MRRKPLFNSCKDKLDHNIMEECNNFMKRVIEDTKEYWTNKRENLSYCTSKKQVATQTKEITLVFKYQTLPNGLRTYWTNHWSRPKQVYWPMGQIMLSFKINPPKEEYIAAVEHACQKLKEGEADELRVEIKNMVKKAQTPSSNISKEEFKTIRELKEDDSRIILTADKGVALVVLNKEDYIRKAEHLLNQHTYRKIPEDPTSKQKARLMKLLKNIKAEGGINEETYKRMYPTGAGWPKFYGLSKIHKPDIPLRPIVSSTGIVSYNTAKELAKILKPLVGHVNTPSAKHQGLHTTTERCKAPTRWKHHLIWCKGTLYICANPASAQHHKEQAWKW